MKVWTVIRDTSGDWGAEGPFIIVAEGEDQFEAMANAMAKFASAMSEEDIDVEEDTFTVAVFGEDISRSLVDGYGVVI